MSSVGADKMEGVDLRESSLQFHFRDVRLADLKHRKWNNLNAFIENTVSSSQNNEHTSKQTELYNDISIYLSIYIYM